MSEALLIGRDAGKIILSLKKYKTVYCFKSAIKVFRSSLKCNIEFVPEDFFMAIDFIRANNRACILLDEIYKQIVDQKSLSPLIDIGGIEYAEFVARKAIFIEMEKICRAFSFAGMVKRHYCIHDRLDFIPGYFSTKVYQKMRQCGLVPDNVDIPRRYFLQMKAYEAAKNNFLRMKLLSYPESLLLKMCGKREGNTIKRFKYGIHLHDGRGFDKREGSMDFIIDDEQIKREDVLFVIDEKPGIPNYVEKVKKDVKEKRYNLVNFYYDIVKDFNPLRYLKEHYLKAQKLKIKILLFTFKCPQLLSACFYAFSDYLLWELFYDKYYVKKFIAIQHPGRLTRIFSNRKNGTESIFVHSSIVFSRLNREKKPEKDNAEYSEYSHLIFDKVCSDKLSNQWLATSRNNIKEYINIGSVFSDIVFEAKNFNKNEVKEKIGISNTKILLSFFDNPIGHHGVLSFYDTHLLIKTMKRLLEEDEDFFVIFKFKKRTGIKQFSKDNKLVKEFEGLFQHSRCLYANNLDIKSYELMGISDLVITAPLSSVMFESLIGGVKTICYDPSGKYNQSHYIIEKFPHFSAHSYEELTENIKYWLKECNKKDFVEFQNNYTKKYVDDYCDGQAMQRFRKVLMTS